MGKGEDRVEVGGLLGWGGAGRRGGGVIFKELYVYILKR